MADLEDARSGAAAPSTDSAHRPRGLSRRWVPLELGAVKRPLPGCVRRFSSCPERCRGAMLQNAGHGHGAQPVQGPERWTVAMLEEAPKRAFARAESRGARPPWVPSSALARRHGRVTRSKGGSPALASPATVEKSGSPALIDPPTPESGGSPALRTPRTPSKSGSPAFRAPTARPAGAGHPSTPPVSNGASVSGSRMQSLPTGSAGARIPEAWRRKNERCTRPCRARGFRSTE